MIAAIEITGLRKTFGRTVALDGLDLEVRTGEVHGFLGPNGSGKSTTIRVLLGLLRADAGDVRLLDGDPWRDAVRLERVERRGDDRHVRLAAAGTSYDVVVRVSEEPEQQRLTCRALRDNPQPAYTVVSVEKAKPSI